MLTKIRRLIASLWTRAGARRQSLQRIARRPGRNLLVLCYGNIYRSPFVEQVLRQQLSDESGWQVRSAGFHHKTGRRVEPGFVEQAQQYAVALDAHRSRQVSADDLLWADLILIMDAHNFRQVWNMDSRMTGKLVWLGSCADSTPTEIQDPYGLDSARQQLVMRQLHEASLAFCARVQS